MIVVAFASQLSSPLHLNAASQQRPVFIHSTSRPRDPRRFVASRSTDHQHPYTSCRTTNTQRPTAGPYRLFHFTSQRMSAPTLPPPSRSSDCPIPKEQTKSVSFGILPTVSTCVPMSHASDYYPYMLSHVPTVTWNSQANHDEHHGSFSPTLLVSSRT